MKSKLNLATLLSSLLLVHAASAQEHIVGSGPTRERITGVGVALGVEEHTLKIMGVVSNTPAFKAGLSPGLVVQKIDGSPPDGKPLDICVAMLRGAVGTKVKLELVDRAKRKTNTIELTREQVL